MTQCLYSKKRLHKNKSINVLLKSIAYFNIENISITNKSIAKLVKQHYPKIEFNDTDIDMLFVEELNAPSFQKMLSEGKFHNDSLILIQSIYQNEERLEQWQQLIALASITVSIDMYHCGLIFIRSEQVKEHFTIRI
ncbi:hypothetical protein MWU56_06225 [Muricauda sp. F6463D]|nr:hypothetical protein [Muricauda sp. F6463D]